MCADHKIIMETAEGVAITASTVSGGYDLGLERFNEELSAAHRVVVGNKKLSYNVLMYELREGQEAKQVRRSVVRYCEDSKRVRVGGDDND